MRVSKVGVVGRCFSIHFSLYTLHTVSTYLITLLSMYLQLGCCYSYLSGSSDRARSTDFRWIAPAGRGNPGPDGRRGCDNSRKKPVSDHFSLTHIVESYFLLGAEMSECSSQCSQT